MINAWTTIDLLSSGYRHDQSSSSRASFLPTVGRAHSHAVVLCNCSYVVGEDSLCSHFLADHTTLSITAEQCVYFLENCSEEIYSYGKTLNQIFRNIWNWLVLMSLSFSLHVVYHQHLLFSVQYCHPALGSWISNQIIGNHWAEFYRHSNKRTLLTDLPRSQSGRADYIPSSGSWPSSQPALGDSPESWAA